MRISQPPIKSVSLYPQLHLLSISRQPSLSFIMIKLFCVLGVSFQKELLSKLQKSKCNVSSFDCLSEVIHRGTVLQYRTQHQKFTFMSKPYNTTKVVYFACRITWLNWGTCFNTWLTSYMFRGVYFWWQGPFQFVVA